ncbi:MAG: YbhB/YbcL family Raf kinase inhibitor-like protein, partial [bacterium]
PSGTHHYNFKLYALDTTLDIPDSSTKADLVNAMTGHILANATLTGLYGN